MVLSDVEETIYVVEVAEMTNESVVRVCFVFLVSIQSRGQLLINDLLQQTVKKNYDMLFVRGDGVVSFSPLFIMFLKFILNSTFLSIVGFSRFSSLSVFQLTATQTDQYSFL